MTIETIEKNLDAMQSSLEELKKTLAIDESLTKNDEFLTIMKEIVNEMERISSNPDMVALQKTMNSHNSINETHLDSIIKNFIDLKIAYTEALMNKTTQVTQTLYDGLLTQKTKLDHLLESLHTQSTTQKTTPNIVKPRAKNNQNTTHTPSNTTNPADKPSDGTIIPQQKEYTSKYVHQQHQSTQGGTVVSNAGTSATSGAGTPGSGSGSSSGSGSTSGTGSTQPPEHKNKWGKTARNTIGGIAIVGGTIRGIKKLRGRITGKKEETNETTNNGSNRENNNDTTNNNEAATNTGQANNNEQNSSKKNSGMAWRKKGLLAVGGAFAGRSLRKNRDTIKEWLGFKKKITLDESLPSAMAAFNDLSGGEQWLKTGFSDIVYNAQTQEILSHGEQTIINEKQKTIPRLAVEFSDFTQMVFTATLINALKRNYKGKGSNAQPFTIDWGGDLIMNTQDSGEEKKEKKQKIISGGMWSSLAKHVPEVDGSFWKKSFSLFGGTNDGKQKLAAYLNTLPLRKAGKATKNNDPESSIDQEIQEEIENTDPQKDHGESRSTITIKKIGEKDAEVASRGQQTNLEKRTGEKRAVVGIDISLPEKEAARLANYINKMKKEYANQGKTTSPFSYEAEWGHKGIWFHPKQATNRTSPKIRTLTNEALKKTMPTIGKNKENITMVINYLNELKNTTGVSWWA